MDNTLDNESSNINPLEIYRILQHTLAFLDPVQIGRCRLVNSSWNDAALSLLRQRQCLYFNSVKSFAKFNAAFVALSDDHKLSLPYKSCMFSSELMDPECPDFMGFHSGAREFFSKFGHYFTQVHFSLGSSYHSAVRNLFQNMIFQWFTNLETLSLLLKESPFNFFPDFGTAITQKLAKLKCLHVGWIGFNNDGDKFDMRQLFGPILGMCVNLEKISSKMPKFLEHGDQSGCDVVEYSSLNDQVLQSIQGFGESRPIQPINSLINIQLILRTSNNQLECLTNYLNLGLQTIYLKLDESVLNETIFDFFQKFAILKSVWIEFPVENASNLRRLTKNIPCVPMINLRQITIVDYEGSFSFLNYLPALKYLEIKGVGGSLPIFKSNSKRLKNISLEKLTMSSKRVISYPNLGIDLITMFPNLRDLTLFNTDNATIQGIFQALPDLRSLHLSGKGITDEGICGESENILKILLEAAVEQWSNNGNNGERCWDFKPRYSSIGRLKCLQSFSIQADLVTDASLVFGISRCFNLKRLEIRPTLELITKFGFSALSQLQDLERLKIFVRNFGWAGLEESHSGVLAWNVRH